MTTVLRLFPIFCYAVAICGCRVERREKIGLRDDANMGVQSKTHMYLISWGRYKDHLEYVAIAGERLPRSATGIVSAAESRGVKGDGTLSDYVKRDYAVVRPDGTRVKVPGAVQLFQKIDGNYFESPERVSLDEFKSFLDSKPEEYDIAHLVAFAKAERNKR